MKKDCNFYVYIMASPSGTLYIGVTNDLRRRVREHKEGKTEGFSKKYGCNRLVFYENFQYISDALENEKRLKKWRREKKEDLIKKMNPGWKDLGDELM